MAGAGSQAAMPKTSAAGATHERLVISIVLILVRRRILFGAGSRTRLAASPPAQTMAAAGFLGPAAPDPITHRDPSMTRSATLAATALGLLLAGAAPAHGAGWELNGSKSIVVTTADGQRLRIGSVQFTPGAGDAVAFKVSMDSERFSDHFLSMREFKCLGGTPELVCHVPYPYPHPGQVSASDLAWLEHSLLFFYKLPGDFGAKLWNGIYFQLQLTEAGLVGKPQAIDLNLIGAPPADLRTPPYRPALRDDMPPAKRWIRSLAIE
jgi:hypothetical protein